MRETSSYQGYLQELATVKGIWPGAGARASVMLGDGDGGLGGGAGGLGAGDGGLGVGDTNGVGDGAGEGDG